jgi:hypothetical protein
MITNCLDYKHRGRTANQTGSNLWGSVVLKNNPTIWGYGSGKFPGDYSAGQGSDGNEPKQFKYSWTANSYACHEGNNTVNIPSQTPAVKKQNWNSVTPW